MATRLYPTAGWEASVGAAELLPFCLATPEARGVLLRHALACVCQRAAAGEAWAAAAALRLAAEESGKTATVRCLAQVCASWWGQADLEATS